MKRAAGLSIAGCAFRAPRRYCALNELAESEGKAASTALSIVKFRDLTLRGVHGVHVFDGEPRGALARSAIDEVLNEEQVDPKSLGLLLDFSTTSRDDNGLSLCYRMQAELGASRAMTLALGNGSCAGFMLALITAKALLESAPDQPEIALLFAEDRVLGRRLYAPFHVLGDGASAVLLRRDGGPFVLRDATVTSIGRFAPVLGIEHARENNFDLMEFERSIVPLHYRVIVDLVARVLDRQRCTLSEIACVLYQNMSQDDARSLAGALQLAPDRVCTTGLAGHGHIFGSDLVINLCLARAEGRFRDRDKALLIASGAGFSWGVGLIECANGFTEAAREPSAEPVAAVPS